MSSVSTSAPKIGFDRYIPLIWMTGAMQVRAGILSRDELDALIDSSELGKEARKKTITVLNRLWLEPRQELIDFADRGMAIYRANPKVSQTALAWGVAIAVYPFFARIAELVGRLTSLQGDCAASEVHRRMSEIYGEREGTTRMTNMALQSQANWGAIDRVGTVRRIVRVPAITLNDDALIAWLIEAALRFSAKAVPVASLGSMAVLYPFELDRPLGVVVAGNANLELRSDGPGNQVVAIRE
jgi:hypothetical protein